jgi:hypothetical protein
MCSVVDAADAVKKRRRKVLSSRFVVRIFFHSPGGKA